LLVEDAQLGEVEDSIYGLLEQQMESLLVAIIMTGNRRGFILSTRAPEHVKNRFEQLRSTITSREIKLMIQADKDWSVNAQFG
jgi:hypothetical protein